MEPWINKTQLSFSQIGLNVFGVAAGTSFQRLLPGCQSVVVIGNGGRQMWTHFIEYLQADQRRFYDSQHPLDDFIEHHIGLVDPTPPPSRRWIRCAATENTFIDFRSLARQAGLGLQSHMGLIIHPEYGLWISFRAAILTTEQLPLTEPVTNNSPCYDCPKYCEKNCIGAAFVDTQFSINRCSKFHKESYLCHKQCNSRAACPVGIQHQHSEVQQCFHSSLSLGRKQLDQFLKDAQKQ